MLASIAIMAITSSMRVNARVRPKCGRHKVTGTLTLSFMVIVKEDRRPQQVDRMVPVRGGQGLAVGRKRQTQPRPKLHRGQLAAGGCVPKFYSAICAGTGERPPVRS